MKIQAAAIQMPCDILDLPTNLQRADELIRTARDAGSELVVLPELFNTGYSLCPDFGPCSETADGPTLTYLRQRSKRWKMAIAAGFVERAVRHLFDSLAFCTPDSEMQIYRKRNLVFWERFRFHPGRAPLVVSTPFGRVGMGICADMIYRRVWDDYRGRIDLAVVAAAWPDFANRDTGRRHWLLGHIGPLSNAIPEKVALDLGIPVVFANQCGETQTTIPVLRTTISDRFAGQSSICDGRHGSPVRADRELSVLVAPITLHSKRGLKSWSSMSHSASAGSFCGSEQS
jgi:predicted amidohydrolase